jgi:hypothetical protein
MVPFRLKENGYPACKEEQPCKSSKEKRYSIITKRLSFFSVSINTDMKYYVVAGLIILLNLGFLCAI